MEQPPTDDPSRRARRRTGAVAVPGGAARAAPRRAIPVAGQLPGYRVPTARRDLVAGVTVAALAIPSAMAYAEVAGRLAGERPLRAAAADRRLRAPRLVAAARRRPGGLGLDARRRGRSSPLAVAGSAGAAELAAMLALLVAACFARRVAAAPRLDRRLLLAAGADRLHPRRRRGPDHRPAREAARALDRRARAAAAALGGRSASSASVSGATLAVGAVALAVAARAAASSCRELPAALLVVVACDRGLVGARPRRRTASRSSARSRRACRASTLPTPAFGDVVALRAGRARHLPRLVRRRDPDRALVRREAQPARARLAGAAGDGRRERRRRASRRASRSARAARAPRSTTRWARAARSPG